MARFEKSLLADRFEGVENCRGSHSHELTEKAMVLDARLKIEETINVRLRKDRRTLEVFKVRIEFILTKA